MASEAGAGVIIALILSSSVISYNIGAANSQKEIVYSNPIDAYFLPLIEHAGSEIEVRGLQDTYGGTWQAEYKNILNWMKEKCTYQKDVARLDEYNAAVEALIYATRIVVVTDWLEDDKLAPGDSNRNSWGNGTHSFLNQIEGEIYRDAGMHLIGYYNEYVSTSREAFVDYVESMCWVDAYVDNSNAFGNEFTGGYDEQIQEGTALPGTASMSRAENYRIQTLHLYDLLYRIGVKPDFIFKAEDYDDARFME